NALTDRHWPLRVEEMVGRLARNSRAFNDAVIEYPRFGRPQNAFFAHALRPPTLVADKFVENARKDENYPWTPAVVELLAVLPPHEVRTLLREAWKHPGLEDAIVRVLAIQPDAADRSKFVVGLKALDPEPVRISAHALTLLPIEGKTEVY